MSKRPEYKQIILNKTQLDQLESYLGIAKDNIADHAELDCRYFRDEIEKQIEI